MRTVTRIIKKRPCYSGRERELLKSFPAILDWNKKPKKSLPVVQESEFKAFPLGNIQEREFPLMPALTTVRLQLLESNSDSSSYIPHNKSTLLFKSFVPVQEGESLMLIHRNAQPNQMREYPPSQHSSAIICCWIKENYWIFLLTCTLGIGAIILTLQDI